MPDDTAVAEADRRRSLRPARLTRRSRPLTMSTPAAVRSRGHRLRLAGLVAAAFVLITAPNVFAANATNINIQLPTGYSIAGTVRDSAGAVLADADVYRHRHGRRMDSVTTERDRHLQDHRPRARLVPRSRSARRPAGTSSVATTHPRHANHFVGGLRVCDEGHRRDRTRPAIDVKLPSGFTVSGTVTNDQWRPDRLSRMSTLSAIVPSYDRAYTDAAGKFTLIGLSAGSVQAGRDAQVSTRYLHGYYRPPTPTTSSWPAAIGDGRRRRSRARPGSTSRCPPATRSAAKSPTPPAPRLPFADVQATLLERTAGRDEHRRCRRTTRITGPRARLVQAPASRPRAVDQLQVRLLHER